ncbi:MAG: Rho-type gtpase-activating protein [Alectoria sarmentosa]|nr:MAG: Rho-type gtpase-activating protein [Alectoria sarmentosa]
MLLDKSLPSLPPSAVNQSAFLPDNESPPSESYSETPTDLPPTANKVPSNLRSRSETGAPADIPRGPPKRPPNFRSHSSRSEKREKSPVMQEDDRKVHSQLSDGSGNGEGFFIPMALDPNPVAGPSPLARRELFDEQRSTPKSQPSESKSTARDYFNAINSASRKSPIEKGNTQSAPTPVSPTSSRHSSPPSQPQSPHIAYQERGRQLSTDFTDQVRSKKELGSNSINAIAHETPRDSPGEESRSRRNGETMNGKFMLQEAPKKKRSSKSDLIPPTRDTSIPASKTKSTPATASTQVKEQQVVIPSHESPTSSHSEANLSGSPLDTQGSRSYTSTDSPISHTSPLSMQLKNLPERGDSLAKPSLAKQSVPRRDLDVATVSKLSNSVSNSESGYEKPASAPASGPASAPATTTIQPFANTNGNRGNTRAQDSPSAVNTTDAPPPPLRARERLALQGTSSSDSFVAPRVPPNPPNTATFKAKTDSMKPESPRSGDSPASPKMRHPAAEGFTMDDDIAHTTNNDGQQDQGGFLRRVSHSVRHARSYSDRGTRLSKEQKWPKSPLVGSSSPGLANELSSPTASSPENKEELRWYRNESRRDKQKMMGMEQRIVELEAAVEAKTTIKQMNTELREKRSTMVVLDTQKEIVVRELEVLTEHIAAAKRSGDPLDVGNLSNAVLREFAESLQKLKDSFAPQIEELTQRRNDLTEEISNLTQLKESSFQEFEQLSLKNAQLADLNNQLVHQVQELRKANTGPALEAVPSAANGLGIYTQNQNSRSNSGMDVRDSRPSFTESTMTGSTVVQENEVEPATYLTAPQMVNIRKAQPKKFNWKKGGHNVAKGVTKGLKGAFSSDGNRNQREGQYPEGMPYGAMQQQEYPSSSLSRNQSHDPARPGFVGFFGNQRGRQQPWKNSPNGSMPAINHEGGPALFGSELEHRAEYERANIPGMDIEGIYRKSGGNSQIQTIKEGFERSNDYDISDPDLDINAVTSTLKQYFRKLPTPLITYEVYDKLLETLPPPGQNPMDIDPSHPAHPNNPLNHTYRVSSMRNAISELPTHHRDTLEVLVFHLARVVDQQADNLMTSQNVAVVFAPTVMRPESLAREMQDTQAKNGAVQFLIEHCQDVFMGDDERR